MSKQALTKQRAAYIEEWTKKNRDRMILRVKKGHKAIIQSYAAAMGTSVNGFIVSAIDRYMQHIEETNDAEVIEKIDNSLLSLIQPEGDKP